jgi:hypothetical protein
VLLLAMVASIGALSDVPRELGPLMAFNQSPSQFVWVADSCIVFTVMLKSSCGGRKDLDRKVVYVSKLVPARGPLK